MLLRLQESYQVLFKLLRVMKNMISLSVKLVSIIGPGSVDQVVSTHHMHYVYVMSKRATALCMQLLTTLTY